MSLPPGFLDELRTRVSLSDVVGRKVAWDRRKSNAARGDWWAPCPFHQEKTASFHVDDRKGFYYCFGCQAKGDAIGFVMESENAGFMEAVEMLAAEAGLAMPARDPKAAEREDRRKGLAEVMEMAVRFLRMQLRTARGAAARDYLAGRGLDDAALERFEIGFAPDDRGALLGHLEGKGVPIDAIVESGMAIRPDDGGKPYDRFRGRIMFPIRDARGRCIAFGGRAMSPDARAKYLNSPDTPLFDKGRTLYNHGPAREAAGRTGRLIVAEGYMDVIALVRAGFEDAAAPLGTAVTEHQLRMMWRMADEPIIALDGDAAGLRAARRVIDVALPMLEAGKTLRFCLLPDKQDPDDVIRTSGREGMEALLDGALPLVEMLWRREIEGRDFDAPERRAALDKRLGEALNRIPDRGLRGHYADALRARRNALFRPEGGGLAPEPGPGFALDAGLGRDPGHGAHAGGFEDRPEPPPIGWDGEPPRASDYARGGRGAGGGSFERGYDEGYGRGYDRGYDGGYNGGGAGFGGGFGGGRRAGGRSGKRGFGRFDRFDRARQGGPSAELRASSLAGADAADARVRESAILLGVLNHPELADRFEGHLAGLRFTQPDLSRLRDALLAALPEAHEAQGDAAHDALRAALTRACGRDPLEALNAARIALVTPGLARAAPIETAAETLSEAFALHAVRLAVSDEIAEAERDLGPDNADEVTHRLSNATRERDRAARGGAADSAGSEAEEALRQELRALHEARIWEKKRRKNPSGGA